MVKQGLQVLRPGGALVLTHHHHHHLYQHHHLDFDKNHQIDLVDHVDHIDDNKVLVGCVTPNTALDITGEQVGYLL